MTQQVTFNFTINLGGTDVSPSAEIDNRSAADGGKNMLTLGKTSGFKPAETVFFLVYTNGFVLTKATSNIGSPVKDGTTSVSIPVQDTLTFDNISQNSGNLSKVPTMVDNAYPVGFTWYVNTEDDNATFGSLSTDVNRVALKVTTPFEPPSGMTDTWKIEEAFLKTAQIASVRADFATTAELWKITIPHLDTLISNYNAKKNQDFPVVIGLYFQLPYEEQ
jgi:hypothetical protein